MEAHEYLRPSAAAIMLRCFGYAQLNALIGAPFIEQEDTEVREDGTACHWLSEQRIAWGIEHPAGTISPNARVITDEMIAAASEYQAIMLSIRPAEYWAIEQKAPVSKTFLCMQDGTPDAWCWDGESFTLTVLDLKFGFRYVDVFENAQLIVYTITIITQILKLPLDSVRVRLGIFQPRAPNHEGAIRWWSPTPTKLYEMWARISAAAAASLLPNAPCTPNPGCGECGAAHACHALRMDAGNATHVSYAPVPAVLDNERLAYELRIRHAAAKTLENQIAALETQAEHALRHGERVIGYEMAPRRTLWRWKDGAQERLASLARYFDKPIMENKPKSVAQLRAVLPASVIDMYAEKPSGGLVLKAVDPKAVERRLSQEQS